MILMDKTLYGVYPKKLKAVVDAGDTGCCSCEATTELDVSAFDRSL
jgi:hypothetical protein